MLCQIEGKLVLVSPLELVETFLHYHPEEKRQLLELKNSLTDRVNHRLQLQSWEGKA